MKKTSVFFAILSIAASVISCQSSAPTSSMQAAIGATSRTPAFVPRDQYRHPQETLSFFGVSPTQTVVEIWPGAGGWYTEILAPLLREQGTLYAAQFPPDTDIGFYSRSLAQFKEKMASDPQAYSQVKISYLYPPAHTEIAPALSADTVLTFRNVHNWAKAGKTAQYFAAFFAALKPGGTLGIVEHRAMPGTPLEKQIKSGYMTEEFVIRHAQLAGFVFDARSDINANRKDQHDHPAGVWTLPPSLRLGDDNRERYLAIGESDRMTLRFKKPLSPIKTTRP